MRRHGMPICVAAILGMTLTACGGGDGASSGAAGASQTSGGGRSSTVVHVVAAEDTWGDIAQQIGGDNVDVTSIIGDPAVDPHVYESSAEDASAIAGAGLVIVNGMGYDDFMDKVLAASPSATRTVVHIDQVVGAASAGGNPHLWYSPDDVPRAAHAIEVALAAADPADSAAFASAEQQFLHGYQPYVDTIHLLKSKHAGAPVGYTERVAGYLVEAAGLRVVTPSGFAQSVEAGSDPSPADSVAMDRAVTSRSIGALLYNVQAESPATKHVKDEATAAGIPVVSVTETMPDSGDDFSTWQIAQARALLTALGG